MEWISVDEELPKPKSRCLFWIQLGPGFPVLGTCGNDEFEFDLEAYNKVGPPVTHWLLIEPPVKCDYCQDTKYDSHDPGGHTAYPSCPRCI